jgi:hypothetical protein
VIWVCGEAEYFCGGDWTGQITLKLLMKIDLSRKIDFRARQLFVERAEQTAVEFPPRAPTGLFTLGVTLAIVKGQGSFRSSPTVNGVPVL